MIEVRAKFESLGRVQKVAFLNACVSMLEHRELAIAEERCQPLGSRIRAIDAQFERRALLHAAKSVLRRANNNAELDARVFFDLLESFDPKLSSLRKRALAASAWATGLSQGKLGCTKADNPYSVAAAELGRQWDRGWEEGHQRGGTS